MLLTAKQLANIRHFTLICNKKRKNKIYFCFPTLCKANYRVSADALTEVVKCRCQTLDSLIQTLLYLTADHHLHHHVELGM